MNATKNSKKQPTTRMTAWNPIARKWQVVYDEDEVPAHKIVWEFWSASLEKWVTIPANER